MIPTVDIIDTLLAGFNPKLKIKNVVDNLDGTVTITVCEPLNLRLGLTFTLNSVVYTVIAIDGNDITYTTAVLPVKGDYVYPTKPFYFHGTPIATNNQLSTINLHSSKLPMVYLIELLKDKFILDKDSAIDRESTVRLFFLDEANFADWDTDQHYALNIVPQANYALAFIEYLKNHAMVGLITGEAELTYYAKFGLSVTQNGVTKNLFNEQLSGVDFTITIPITKDLTLCTCN